MFQALSMGKMQPTKSSTPELQRLRDQAKQLRLSDRHDRAEIILRQILAVEPNDADAKWQLGFCLLMLRRLDEALEQAKAAVALDPLSVASLGILAAILTALGHHDEAIALYEQALQIKADHTPAMYGLSNALGMNAKWAAALEWADRGLAIEPNHVGMLRIRGEALAVLNRKEDAIASMQEFLRLAPDSAESQIFAGSILSRIGKTEEAAEFARRALIMSPADPSIHNTLARIQFRGKNTADAERHFKHAAEIYGSRSDGQKGSKGIQITSMLGQAAVNVRKRNFRLAETQYRQILELNPTHNIALALLAHSIGAQYRFAEAIPMAREAIQQQPKLLTPREVLASLLTEMERNDEAIIETMEALKLHPDAGEPHRILACVYLDLENFQKAYEEAERALAHPELSGTRSIFAIALAALGRRDEAINSIEATLREEQDHYLCHAMAGYSFHLLKEYRQAESNYRHAMELDPSGLGCHGHLGLVYFDQGRIAKARPLLEKSMALNPYPRRVRAALAASVSTAATAD